MYILRAWQTLSSRVLLPSTRSETLCDCTVCGSANPGRPAAYWQLFPNDLPTETPCLEKLSSRWYTLCYSYSVLDFDCDELIIAKRGSGSARTEVTVGSSGGNCVMYLIENWRAFWSHAQQPTTLFFNPSIHSLIQIPDLFSLSSLSTRPLILINIILIWRPNSSTLFLYFTMLHFLIDRKLALLSAKQTG